MKFRPNQKVFYIHEDGRSRTFLAGVVVGLGRYERQWRVRLVDYDNVVITAQEEDLQPVPEQDMS